MSIESWKEEFYPVDADDCPEHNALMHSLLKWTGLLNHNLIKHDVETTNTGNLISSNGSFSIDAESCALCKFYDDDCEECPLIQYDPEATCGTHNSPWKTWMNQHNPKPMIKLITETIEADNE